MGLMFVVYVVWVGRRLTVDILKSDRGEIIKVQFLSLLPLRPPLPSPLVPQGYANSSAAHFPQGPCPYLDCAEELKGFPALKCTYFGAYCIYIASLGLLTKYWQSSDSILSVFSLEISCQW